MKTALREFGADPVTGRPVVVKDGRSGPYVTDGQTNATVPRSETVEGLTEERAYTLLADRRDKAPAPRRLPHAKLLPGRPRMESPRTQDPLRVLWHPEVAVTPKNLDALVEALKSWKALAFSSHWRAVTGVASRRRSGCYLRR